MDHNPAVAGSCESGMNVSKAGVASKDAQLSRRWWRRGMGVRRSIPHLDGRGRSTTSILCARSLTRCGPWCAQAARYTWATRSGKLSLDFFSTCIANDDAVSVQSGKHSCGSPALVVHGVLTPLPHFDPCLLPLLSLPLDRHASFSSPRSRLICCSQLVVVTVFLFGSLDDDVAIKGGWGRNKGSLHREPCSILRAWLLLPSIPVGATGVSVA